MNEHQRQPAFATRVARLGVAGVLALAACCFVGTGCQSGGKKAADPPATAGVPATLRYRVVADTPLYKYGPQQANGPDETLKKDAELTMIKRAYGYSEVSTAAGQTGYVGTEDITQMTAEDIAAEDAAQQQMAAAPGQKPSNAIVGEYQIPPEAGNQERLPEPDGLPTPKPTPTPPFRY